MAWNITELKSLEHDATLCTQSCIARLDATRYILAYRGVDSDGFVKIIAIASDGTPSEVSSLEFDTTDASHPSIAILDSTHFVIAWGGSGSDGYIATFTLDGSYNITKTHEIEHDTTFGFYNSLVAIDSTHVILAYSGSGADGFIKVFTIDGSFNISQTTVLEHDTTIGYYNSLLRIDSTHFILAYMGSAGDDGFIKTFTLDGSYNITQSYSLEHDTDSATFNSLCAIDSTHFILAYRGTDGDGFITTFSINGSYEIAKIASLEHDTADHINECSLVKIDATHYALAYASTGNDGYIKIFTIDGSYGITQTASLLHDDVYSQDSSMVYYDGRLILAYSGADTAGGTAPDGFIKTFSVGEASTTNPNFFAFF